MKLKTYIIIFSAFIAASFCYSEDSGNQVIIKRYQDLASMNSAINNLKILIDSKTKDLQTERDDIKKNKINDDISRLNQKLDAARMTFANTVSDAILFLDDEDNLSKQKDRDAIKELQDLMLPLIDSIKEATKKPRRIEKLRYDIEKIDGRISVAEKALRNIETIETSPKITPFKDNIDVSRKMIQKYISDASLQKNICQNELDKELKGKSSIFAITDMVREFFSTKGKNLLIALGIGFLIVFLFSWLRKRLFSIRFFNHDAKHFKKAFYALYGAITGVISILAAVCALYVLNDWFLFSFSILVLLGVFWSLKKYLPRFLAEIKLLLNLGPVKEGQRIVWNNCPWIVKKLGMTVQLENDCLNTPVTILPIREILSLYSRPLTEGEQLFPSRRGDYVMLSTGSYGEVKIQTPENVVIAMSSTLDVTYTVQEYFHAKPQNYSNGFQLSMLLPLDYRHQKNVFELEKFVKQELSAQMKNNPRYPAKYIRNIVVEFKEPSALSLDLMVWLDCAGELAPEYKSLRRFVNSIILKICNDKDLVLKPK